jgi:hypothetical protein
MEEQPVSAIGLAMCLSQVHIVLSNALGLINPEAKYIWGHNL